jgi:hypothetical protein
MKTIYPYLLLIAIFLFPFSKLNAQDLTTGDLKITVNDEHGEPMPGAVVIITSGVSHLGGSTNIDGTFTFRALNPGPYNVEARMLGYKKYTKNGIMVNAGQTAYADYPMQVIADNDSTVTIYAVSSPVDPKFSTIHNINAAQLKTNAGGRSDVLSLIEGTSSDLSIGKNGNLVMRGSREGASTMYVDGEKVYGDAGVPGGSIQQVTVLSGGIPAAYGDMSGGVVIITTKTFESGFAEKQARYDAAEEEAIAAKKAEAEKNGQTTDKDGNIIEQVKPQTPAPQAPAPQAPAQVPAPKN